MGVPTIRLAVLSNAELDPWVNWTTLGPPLLEPLAEHPAGQLIAPPPWTWGRRVEWLTAIRLYRSCDAAFWMQASSRPEVPVWALSATKARVRRSAFVVDAWPQVLTKVGLLAIAQKLSPCFVAFREAHEQLRRRFPRGDFEWLPFGVDTEVFKPGHGERDVFAYWMGRRSEPLHQALFGYCKERELEYRYTKVGGEFRDPIELGELVGRCKYFVVTPPEDPARTGGFSPLMMRYLEGLAAGARLLGTLPRSGEFEDLLPRGSLCEVRADGADLAEKLDADAGNSDGWRAVETARDLVRTEHSWFRRAEQIRERLASA